MLVLCCTLVMTGCQGRSIVEDNNGPALTLPPAEARYTAPDGDGIIAAGKEYRMYLPSRDNLRLISRSIQLEAANLNDTVEALVRSLIAWEGDEET